MKKTKLLIPTLATIGSLTAVAPTLTACNKKTVHIVEPTDAEKQKTPDAGELKATYTFTFNDEIKDSELTVTLKNVSEANEDAIQISSLSCTDKKCTIVVEWKDIPFDTTTCSFTFGFVSTKGWTQDITKCSIKYTLPSTKFTIKFANTTLEDQTVKYGNYATQPATPTKQGSVFAGWYQDAALEKGFNFETTRIFADTTIYAKWVKTGYEVDSNEWNAAFASIADTRKELNFWTDGTIVQTYTNKSSGEVKVETTNKIIFKEDKHCAHTDSVTKSKTGEITDEREHGVAGEYFNNFFFTAEQELGSRVKSYSWDVQFYSKVTDLFYTIYNAANGNHQYYTYKDGTYTYKDGSITSEIQFNENKQVQSLKYKAPSSTSYDDIVTEFDLTFNYGKKDFTLPEGWDENKATAERTWNSGSASTQFAKGTRTTGVTVAIDSVSGDQIGAKSITFRAGGTTVSTFRDNEIAMCITRADETDPEWCVFKTSQWSNKRWNIPLLEEKPLAEGDKVTFLVRYYYSYTTVEAELLSE